MDDEKKQYSKISKSMRQEIIQKIVYDKEPLSDVAQIYSLLPSTCKSIVNTYMKEGRVGKKESRIRKLNKIVTTYHILLNPINPLLSQVQVQRTIETCVEQSIKSRKETEETIDQSKVEKQTINQYFDQWSEQLQQQLKFLQGGIQKWNVNV